MSGERLSTRLVRLFELWILHHYWLDDGATLFDALPQAEQEARLRGYDVRRLLEIRPSAATVRRLAGLDAIWSTTSLGLIVALPEGTVVPDTSVFEFTLRIVDRDLPAYSSYGLSRPTSVDAYDKATRKVLRYRADAALYSNLTGCKRGSGDGLQLFLSREIPARQSTDRVEFIVNDAGALVQLLADPPAPNTVQLGPDVAALPAFATHADVSALTAPPTVIDPVPPSGILLPEGAPGDTHALIRIAAHHPSDEDLGCTSGGTAKPVSPRFQLRFKNRFTLWRRFERSSPLTAPTDEGPFPLTHRGNPSTGPKPSGHAVKLDRAGTAIQSIVSEIYA